MSWKSCSLGEIASIQTGPFGSQLHSSDYVAQGIPLVMPVNIGRNLEIIENGIAHISYYDAERLKRHALVSGDIIYSRRGDVEKCAFIKEKQSGWICGTGCLAVRFFSGSVYPQFLAYQFLTESIKGWILGHAVGTTMPNLNSNILSNLPVVLPPLSEQKAIADILGSLDDKIDLLQRQNTTLEAMAETLFRQWFIEEAQEDWGEQAFGNIVTFHDSKRIPLSKTEREKMQSGLLYPYYGAAQIVGYVNNFIFNGDYLLFAEDGTVRTDSGTPVLQRAYGKFWVNNHTHVITANYPYNNDFLYIFLLRKNIDELITGAVQPKISQSNLRKLPIPHYPIELVKKYILLTKNIFSKIRSNQQQIRTLEKLRDTLLPKLMSGEVRVRVDG